MSTPATSRRSFLEDREGFSLYEILIALSIVGILLVAVGGSFQGWMAKHRVVASTQQLFADIIDARSKAMQRSRGTFVVLGTSSYSTFEDTSPAPDGNMLLEAADRRMASGTSLYAYVTEPAGVTQFRFDRSGFSSFTGFIRLDSTLSPDVDCISIGPTRVKLGRYDRATNSCIEQ